MATPKQIAANIRNAAHSTGPKTNEGKLHSRANALKHGLGAIHVPLAHEDPAEFAILRAGIVESWNPANPQEFLMVDLIATAAQKLARVQRFEASLFDLEVQTVKRRNGKKKTATPSDDGPAAFTLGTEENIKSWDTLARYETRAQSAYHRAVDSLRRLQNDRLSRPLKQLREHIAHEKYLKMTVAQPATPAQSTKMGSFRPPAVVPIRS